MALHPADHRHHDWRGAFRPACWSSITATTDPPRLRLRVRGRLFNRRVVVFVPPSVPVSPLFVFTMGTSIVMPSVTLLLLDLFSGMRGLVSSLAGFVHFVQFAFSEFNSGTIALFLAHLLALSAGGMATPTVASFVLWVVYRRRGHVTR